MPWDAPGGRWWSRLMFDTAKSGTRVPQWCLAIYCAAWAVLAIEPWDRGAWLLENILPLVTVPTMLVTFRRFRFSDRAYVRLTAFMLMHAIGSHYTYSRVPVGDWVRDVLEADRNHYDRLVHFAFGLLGLLAVCEFFFRPPARMPQGRQLALGVALIAALSTAYEVVEWWTAVTVDPAAGTAFLGTQGDSWDAQKDMLCAIGGALLAAVAETRRVNVRSPSEPQTLGIQGP